MSIILAALLLQPKAEPPLAILQKALLPLQARSATVSFTTSDRLIGRWVVSGKNERLTLLGQQAGHLDFITDGVNAIELDRNESLYFLTPQRGLGPTEELSEFLELGYPYYINPAPVSSLSRFKATSSKDANGNLLTFTYAGDAAKTVLSYQISTAGKLASYRLVVTSPQGGTDQKFTFQSIATTKSFAPGTFSMAIPDKYVPLFLSESDPISTDYPFPDLDLGTRKLSSLISKNLTVITLDRRNTSSVPTADIMNRVSATLAPFSASVGRILVSLDGAAPGWLATKLNSNERLAAYGTPVFALVNQKRQILGLWMGIDSEIPGQMKQAISDILTPKSRVKPKNASAVRSRL